MDTQWEAYVNLGLLSVFLIIALYMIYKNRPESGNLLAAKPKYDFWIGIAVVTFILLLTSVLLFFFYTMPAEAHITAMVLYLVQAGLIGWHQWTNVAKL